MNNVKKSLLKELNDRRKEIQGRIDLKSKEIADKEGHYKRMIEEKASPEIDRLNVLMSELEKVNKQIAWLERVSNLKDLKKKRETLQEGIKEMQHITRVEFKSIPES